MKKWGWGIAFVLWGVVLGVEAAEAPPEPLNEDSRGAVLFGGSTVQSNLLKCVYFDFKRDRRGKPIQATPERAKELMLEFMLNGWRTSKLARFYRSPNFRYAPAVMIPPVPADICSAAYQETENGAFCWMLYYEGELTYPEDITFRFWGSADDELFVRVNGQVVLGHSFNGEDKSGTSAEFSKVWKSSEKLTNKYKLGNDLATVGDWVSLKAGQKLPIQILAAELPGGDFGAMLLVEVQGVDYPRNPQTAPVLPVFRVGSVSDVWKDQVGVLMPAGEADLHSDLVFGEEMGEESRVSNAVFQSLETTAGSGLRIWTGDKGQILEARFAGVSGVNVVLEDAAGKQRRVPIKRLSREDQIYIDLIYNLEHKVKFEGQKKESRMNASTSPYVTTPYAYYEYSFTADILPVRSSNKTHELLEELCIIAPQREGNGYILVAREASEFTANAGSKSPRQLAAQSVCIPDEIGGKFSRDVADFDYVYLIRAADGHILKCTPSEKWLLPIAGKISTLHIGAHFDQSGNRISPNGSKFP